MADENTHTPVPGPAHDEERRKADLQVGIGGDLADGFRQTAAYDLQRIIRDEGTRLVEEHGLETDITEQGPLQWGLDQVTNAGIAGLSIFGWREGDPDYDKQELMPELTKGVPYMYWDDIMAEDNYDAAMRARARVLQDIEIGQRMAGQDSGTVAHFAGGMLDIDLPLAMVSGGAFGAAKATRAGLRTSTAAGFSAKSAKRVGRAFEGANSGFQAGVLVGAAQAKASETDGWEDFANLVLMNTVMAGGLKVAGKTEAKLAQDEFFENIRTNNPGFHKQLDVNTMPTDDLRIYTEMVEEGSMGAAATPGNTAVKVERPDLDVGFGAPSPTHEQWITMAQDWRHNSDWGDQKVADMETTWGKVIGSDVANVFNQDHHRMFKSKAATANYVAGNILESANGLGRGKATSSVRMENYHRRIQSHVGRNWFDNLNNFAREQDDTMMGSGYGWSRSANARFNREVQLEMNDRRMGRTPSEQRSMYVRKQADELEASGQESLHVLKGRDGERAVSGFEDFDTNVRGYLPYTWQGATIKRLVRDKVITHDSLVSDLSIAYEAAGLATGKDLEAIADAVVKRAIAKTDDIDMNVQNLLTADGKEWLRQAMLDGGASAQRVDGIMERLQGAQHNRSKEGFAKSRNDIDLAARITTADGSDLQIVDLMNQDVHGTWQRYSRRVAGTSALARAGITNRAERTEFINAIRKEQEALGEEPLSKEYLEAVFSHFDGAAIQGWDGRTRNKGVSYAQAQMKRVVNLGLLEQLGITQLSELNNVIWQNGLRNSIQRGLMPFFDKALAKDRQGLLDDLSFVTGEIGRDQWHFAQWMDMDDLNDADLAQWQKGVNKITGGASAVQAYTNAFNQVRTASQTMAATGVTDKIFRKLKQHVDDGTPIDEDFLNAARIDFGLFPDDLQALSNMVENGLIEFSENGEFVNRVFMDQWDPELAEIYGSAIMRNMNQVVQKTMAGEGSAWMHSEMGSLFTHLKSFPMASIQKQFARNFSKGYSQGMGYLASGMITAALAVMTKNAINGRDQDAEGIARGALNYNTMIGWMPTVVDPMLSMIGMDDMRMNPYGPYTDIMPPVATVGMDLLRAPGGVANAARGNADYYDWKAIKALPFMNTYGMSLILD